MITIAAAATTMAIAAKTSALGSVEDGLVGLEDGDALGDVLAVGDSTGDGEEFGEFGGDGETVGGGVGVAEIGVKFAVIVPGPFIVTVVNKEFESKKVTKLVLLDHPENR